MRSEDETSPRPTKRRRISQDYKGISIMKERKRDVNPSKPESYAHIISQEPFKSSSSGVIGRRSISPSHFGGSHVDMNESQSGDIVDTSDNEEMHILHDFQLYRSDAPSPSTYRDPWKHSLKSTSPVAFSQSSSTVRATESSPVIVDSVLPSTSAQPSPSSPLASSFPFVGRSQRAPQVASYSTVDDDSVTETDEESPTTRRTQSHRSPSKPGHLLDRATSSSVEGAHSLTLRTPTAISGPSGLSTSPSTPIPPSLSSQKRAHLPPLNISQPTSHTSKHRALPGSSPLVLEQLSSSSSPQNVEQRSPSLTPPPPSPPKRRTRETNKFFRPYTAYIKQWGDKELKRLEEEARTKQAHRPGANQGDAVEDEDEDASWVASQSLVDEESQSVSATSILHTAKSRIHVRPKPKPPPVVYPALDSVRRSRPDVPIPNWNNNQSDAARRHVKQPEPSTETDVAPLKLRQPGAPRRFLDLDGSPVANRTKSPARENGGNARPSYARTADSPDAVHDALRRLYADEEIIDINSSDPGDDHMLDVDEGNAAPPTDPDTAPSGLEEMEEDADSENEESQFPVRKSKGLINKRYLIQDQEESQERDVVEENQQENSDDEEDEDGVDKERERILAKVWPAVLIKKNAERERERELERQRKRRDEERARRQALGLGDSDASDDDMRMDGSLRPGQSRTRRMPDENILQRHPASSSEDDANAKNARRGITKEIIDLTSDRESLDNDDPIDIETQDVLSDDAKAGQYDDAEDWMQYDYEDLPMEGEAVEDNRLFDGAKVRQAGSSNSRSKQRLSRSDPFKYNSRDRQRLWQSRIDQMLNSTNGGTRSQKRSRRAELSSTTGSKRTGGHVWHSDRPRTIVRFSSDTHMVTNSAGAFGLVQSRLPFESIQNDDPKSREPRAHVSSERSGHQSRSRSSPGRGSKRGHGSSSKAKKLGNDGLLDLFDVLTPAENIHQPKSSAPTATKTPSTKDPPSKSSKIHQRTRILGPSHTTPIPVIDPQDPDSKIEISLNSALAFGMRRNRDGYSVLETSWIAQGRLLDLVNVLCERKEPAKPLPCYASTLHLDSSTPAIDLQLQFPTICDLLFEFVTRAPQQQDENYIRSRDLMRFVCLYVSASIKSDAEEGRTTLRYIRSQLVTLVDRVEEHVLVKGSTGAQYGHALFSFHWFTVEVTNRIIRSLATLDRTADGEETILSDATTDRFTILLMSRLLEFGVRRAALAFTPTPDRPSSIEQYALELWLALIHITVLLPATHKEAVENSTTFWRQLIQAIDQSNRQFPSAVHETEFMFATIFFLCSISSIDALGLGQESRVLHAYWPIVCKALKNVDLSTQTAGTRKLSQATLAAKDTYVGMLFARCNVLAFRWEWSLEEDSKELFDVLRGVLKVRRFMNLLHEQSDFPYFITKKNLRLLHVFEPKDSIQTIVIKLMLKKVLATGERIQSAKKWISLLASTAALEFTREKPPTQKELSALFNQFTIKLVFLYINPDVNNLKAQISSSKKIVNFQDADQKSRQICIRTAMIFGRFCRHFGLHLEDTVQWMTEMGNILLTERPLLAGHPTNQKIDENDLLCALLVASLRDVLNFKSFNDGYEHEAVETLYPESSLCMIDFLTKLMAVRRAGGDVSQSEIALLLKTILDLREAFFPQPNLPSFPSAVVDEESQEDYGFDPIDISDPTFMEIMKTHEDPLRNDRYWDLDTKLAESLSQLNSPVASIIGGLSYSDDAKAKRTAAELWIHCYVRIGAISTVHGIKSWDYYLQRGPASLGRSGDPVWQQETEPVFWLEVLRSDIKVYHSHAEQALKTWFMTLAADPARQLPAYTYVLFRIDGLKHKLLEGIPFRRSLTEEEYDDDAYISTRLDIVQGVLQNLDRYHQTQVEGAANAAMIKVAVQGLEWVELMLTMMGHNVKTKYANEEFREYCHAVATCIRTLSISSHPQLGPLLAPLE